MPQESSSPSASPQTQIESQPHKRGQPSFLCKTPAPAPHAPSKRSAWREQLVQAERGVVGCFRSDSSLFVHFFGASIVLAASGVLALGSMQWAAILIALTVVLSAEMFNHAIRTLVQSQPSPQTETAQRILAMSSAAVMTAIAGAGLVIGLVFWERVEQLF